MYEMKLILCELSTALKEQPQCNKRKGKGEKNPLGYCHVGVQSIFSQLCTCSVHPQALWEPLSPLGHSSVHEYHPIAF